MTLHLPNASRNYNPTQRCVCFWGHDSAFEVSFHLDEEALCKISPYVDRNAASLLHVFDVNRVRIQEAASVAYSRRRQNYHRLSASDLLEPVHRGRKHGYRHSNREAKRPKKLKPKEIGPISTLASIQKNALEATNQLRRLGSWGVVPDREATGAVSCRQHLP